MKVIKNADNKLNILKKHPELFSEEIIKKKYLSKRAIKRLRKKHITTFGDLARLESVADLNIKGYWSINHALIVIFKKNKIDYKSSKANKIKKDKAIIKNKSVTKKIIKKHKAKKMDDKARYYRALRNKQGAKRGISIKQFDEIIKSCEKREGKFKLLKNGKDTGLTCDSSHEQNIFNKLTKLNVYQKIYTQIGLFKYGSHYDSTYFPDFVMLDNYGQIIVIEVKEFADMAKPDVLHKYNVMKLQSEAKGYIFAMVNKSFINLDEVRTRKVSKKVEKYLFNCLNTKGKFTCVDYKNLKEKIKMTNEELRRNVAAIVIENNLYMKHDLTRGINKMCIHRK